MKRQRGRGRKPGGGHHNHNNHGHQPNRAIETNGPDTKFRGTASYIYERYLQLARDAASAGDRVLSENYQQHADHYFRLLRSMQPATPPPQQAGAYNGEHEDEGPGAEEVESGEEMQTARPTDETGDGEAGEAHEAGFARDGDNRRRRGRRNRFRPGTEGEGEERPDGGEVRRDREESREPRRQQRERNAERDAGGQEGFSDGPKPAFLRD